MSESEDTPAKYLENIRLDPKQFPYQLYGWPYWKHQPVIKDVPAQIRALRKFEMRFDDVIIAAFPKCGTHWVGEVVSMLRKGKAEIDFRTKGASMLDFMDLDHLENMSSAPSPRTLNSHNAFCHLPQQIVEKKVKVIHLVRNPKDVIVSGWYHFSSMFSKGLTLNKHFEQSITNTRHNPNQLWFERQIQAWRSFYPSHPVHTVCYEDMKRNPLEITQKIAHFLGLDVTTEFCQEVVDACSFDKMKEANKDRKVEEHINVGGMLNKFQPYRKGIVGDWKNHFTVAQNEAMDAYIEREAKDLNVAKLFRYE